jgi:hypothetical protein
MTMTINFVRYTTVVLLSVDSTRCLVFVTFTMPPKKKDAKGKKGKAPEVSPEDIDAFLKVEVCSLYLLYLLTLFCSIFWIFFKLKFHVCTKKKKPIFDKHTDL